MHFKGYLKTQIVLFLDIFVSFCASACVLILLMLLAPQLQPEGGDSFTWLCTSAVASAVAFYISKVYRDIIRYSTLRELGRLGLAVLGKEVLLCGGVLLFGAWTPENRLLWAMVLLDFLTTLTLLMLMRTCMVVVYDRLRRRGRGDSGGIHTVVVYGVGDKSASIVSRLRNSDHYRVVGFIAPGKALKGHLLAGMPVGYFEKAEDVVSFAASLGVRGVLFPYVADARSEQDRLIPYCREAGLRTYLTPGIDEITENTGLGLYVRKINIEDLLGRPEIKISMSEIVAGMKEKTVMVTGAAGSIGSELCRQIAAFGVRRLVLFDNAETPLHNIRLELGDRFPELDFIPVIGDVRSKERLDFVFRNHRPQVVFHAAAYKHVPLMEENPCEAVLVNVVGSRQVADKCVEYGVEKMVMISTDKAVNPTNIMGCTKRLAEIYVQSLGLAIERGEVNGKTRFVTTRFGNVLGSNGSVIPRFREQIEHGGPVTVTHPEITRFFMTIPEACRLVMEAATVATGTQIFVFDMGESVKIRTLAERMITLAGLEPGKDIRIEYTGLRPGEKLYEEVLADMENTLPTSHSRIFIAKVREYDYRAAAEAVEGLKAHAMTVDIPPMVRLMKQTVPEYKSAHSEFEAYDK